MRSLLVPAVLLTWFDCSLSHAYPIPPRTLWSLVDDAELIVVAKVEEAGRMAFPPDTYAELAFAPDGRGGSHRPHFGIGDLYHLRVVETWKGPDAPVVEVDNDDNTICPAPGRFVPGETVLAFLSGNRGSWFATHRSYGTLYPTGEGLAVFRSLVRSRLAMLARGKVTDKERHAWLLEAASHSATRWHGLYELTNVYDEAHRYYDRERSGTSSKAIPMTSAERRALAKAFVEDPTADSTLAMLLHIVACVRDPAFDATVVNVLDHAVTEEDSAYWLTEVLPLVAKRFGLEPPNLSDDDLDGADPLASDPLFKRRKATTDAWLQLRQNIRIPEARVRPKPTSRVHGVGSNTPP